MCETVSTMEIHLINYINILECILGLQRTILNSTWSIRVLRFLYTLSQHLLLSFNIVQYYLYPIHMTNPVWLAILTNAIDFSVIIILAVYKSKKYEQMSEYLNINHMLFKSDAQYNKDLRIVFIWTVVSSLVFIVVQLSAYYGTDHVENAHIACIAYASMGISNIQFIFEFFACFSILSVMSEQLENITRSIKKIEISDNGAISDVETREKLFNKWCTTYTNLKESSKLFNNIYGFQVGASNYIRVAVLKFGFFLFI